MFTRLSIPGIASSVLSSQEVPWLLAMSSGDTFGSGLLGCTLYKVVITRELMSLASGLRGAQMHELTLLSHCSQLSQDLGGCCIHSGFLGCWPKRRTLSVHPGLSRTCVACIDTLGMIFEGLFCWDITTLFSECLFLCVSVWISFLL